MTIKFKRFADNYMCRDYFYDIWNDKDAPDRHQTVKKVTMPEYEFENLFREMAIELGYIVNKSGTTMWLTKEEKDDLFKQMAKELGYMTYKQDQYKENECHKLGCFITTEKGKDYCRHHLNERADQLDKIIGYTPNQDKQYNPLYEKLDEITDMKRDWRITNDFIQNKFDRITDSIIKRIEKLEDDVKFLMDDDFFEDEIEK